MGRDSIATFAVIVVSVIGIVAGSIYISKHVSCWDFFGLYKGCGVSTIK